MSYQDDIPTDPAGKRDSSTRIIAAANKEAAKLLTDWDNQNTDQHRMVAVNLANRQADMAKRHARSRWAWGVFGAVASALMLGVVGWTWGAVTDKAKTLITKELATKVDEQNTANNEAHETLTRGQATLGTDVAAIKVDLADKGTMIEALFDLKTEPALDARTVRAKVLRKRAALKAAQQKDPTP